MTVRLVVRRVIAIVAVAGIAAGVSACGQEEATRPATRSADGLLDGGTDAFRAKLAELRGTPVVVNQWASWCGPCRFEFPFFRSETERLKGKVAFLGVNSRDSRAAAVEFLDSHPVPFEHFYDKDASIARVFRGGRSWPTTAFYNARGELTFVHQGAYASRAKLAEEIERYALDG
jgi:thiol-disulfide isomerase/thioredoxin